MRDERGSGSILAITIGASALTVAVAMVGACVVFVDHRAADNAADAAALAGADVASGRIPGVVCEAAGQAAAANGGELTECTVEGLIVTVTVVETHAGLTGRARAGPPR